jgi:ATP-dependent DNA ligase
LEWISQRHIDSTPAAACCIYGAYVVASACLSRLLRALPAEPRRAVHEIKHDGFRVLARGGASGVRLFTRNGHDWTERFPLIVEALSTLKVTTCLLDGEAVTCNETGLAEFEVLRSRRGDVHLCAFDLLELDGRDLRLEPRAIDPASAQGAMRPRAQCTV